MEMMEIYINAVKSDYKKKQADAYETLEKALHTLQQVYDKSGEIEKERDAAIADIESMMQNVNSNIVCRWCKHYCDASQCEFLTGEDCKPEWRGAQDDS